MRVVSKTGMSKSLLADQHGDLGAAHDDAVDLFIAPHARDFVDIGRLRCRGDDALAEFVVDHAVDHVAPGLVRHHRLQAVLLGEPALVEILLHGEARRQQRRAADAGAGSTATAVASAMWMSGIDTAACTASASLCMVLVQISSPSAPRSFQLARRIGQQHAGALPVAGVLPFGDLGEVERPQQQSCRMQAAEALAHDLVEQAIVDRRRFPAHAADQAKGFHVFTAPMQIGMIDLTKSSAGRCRPAPGPNRAASVPRPAWCG